MDKPTIISISPLNHMYSPSLYQTIKNIGKLLGKSYTIEIIFHLSHEPMRYTQIKTILRCKDNTLSRRLEELQKYNVIQSLTVSFGNKSGHEYTITDLGQELIRFFQNFEKQRINKGR